MTILQSSIASNVISGATGPTGATGPAGTNGTNGSNGATGASPWSLSGSDTYYTAGNVGVGTASPASVLDVKAGSGSVISRSTSGYNFKAYYDDGRTTYTAIGYDGLYTVGAQPLYASSGTGFYLRTNTNASTVNAMFVDNDGYFLMAPDYRTVPRGRVDISAPGNSVDGLPTVCLAMSRWGDAGPMVNFFSTHNSTTSIGNIYNAGGTNTQYNTSSDYRLKENITPMTGALSKVALLKPCTYTWKSTGAAGQGFIAHELDEVVPDAVCGEKDAVDANGNVVSQSIDTSYLVATLTAAIQEQQAMIEELKSEVAALKANNQ